ncbi:RNA 2',3'-cyclic phosphodiesterase [bacterium]|nr:RNA 2',3'-cyclic phosphodiesterase [bacterium]
MVEKEKVRAFLAFDIPKHVTQELQNVVEQMDGKAKGVQWVKPEQYHCTIKFFGDVDEDVLTGALTRSIQETLVGKTKVKVACKGVGVFPNWRYPKVIWAGLVGDTYELINLHGECEDDFEKLGIERDQRTFRMHLTIGRAKSIKNTSALMRYVEKLVNKSFGEINIDKLILYRSQLTKSGPIYTVVREFLLGD